MGWIERVKGALDRAGDSLGDIQESGLAENASKVIKSVSKVIGRYAKGDQEEKPPG